MTEQKKEELRNLQMKFAQHCAMLGQTFDNSPRPDTSAWADDVRKLTETPDGLAMEIQKLFESEKMS